MLGNNNQITYFAKTNFRNQEKKFGIKTDDRRRHMYVVGKTGMGKTELLKNMVIQDIEAGCGVAFVDPHGDSVEEILECIPGNRINDVIYFNPADLGYPIAFNILENVAPEYKHLVADGLMGVFTKIWANMWSARMEYILRNCILALLDVPGNTLLGVMRLLVDKEFRHKIVDKVKDPVVKTFWTEEYANYNDRFRTEAIAPIQNKVGQFLSSAVIRNIVGQPKSTIDPRVIMDEGKILLLNLSKGRIGEDNSNLLGAMMITKMQLAAMSRVDMPEKERRDFYLYVDEFQNFATESFADIMSEARKYRLNLTLAHQYIAQLTTKESTKVRDAIFGNVGTIICFRIGAADAEFLVKEFEPYLTEEDLVNLNKFDIYLRLMIDGTASKPFSATTLPPLSEGKPNLKNKEKVIKVSQERYANPKDEVEEKIIRWLDLEDMFKEQAVEGKLAGDEVIYKAGHTVGRNIKTQKTQKHENTKTQEASYDFTQSGQRQKSVGDMLIDKKQIVNQLNKIEAVCDNCNRVTHLSFIPKPHLNVFCKQCLKKFKKGEIDVSKLPLRNVRLAEVYKDIKTLKHENISAKGGSPPDGRTGASGGKTKEIEKEERKEQVEENATRTFPSASARRLGERAGRSEKNKNKINFLAAAGDEVISEDKDEKVSLHEFKTKQPVSFKGGGAKSVKPGQSVKL